MVRLYNKRMHGLVDAARICLYIIIGYYGVSIYIKYLLFG